MSGKLIGWAMAQATGSPVTKLVLVKLADNANETGYCCASIELIVKHTELSERAVREHLYRLEKLHLIKVERRSVDGVQLRNLYHLCVPETYGANARVLQEVQGGALQEVPPPRQEVQTPAARGAKGVLHDVQANKDNPQVEPLRQPTQHGRVAHPLDEATPEQKKPKSEYSYGFEKVWPEFRKWPDNNGTKYAAWMAYQRTKAVRPSDDDLVVAARAEARWLAEQNRNRKPNDQQKPKHPSTWLHNRGWERWLDEATAREASNYPPIKVTLAPQHVEALRNAGLTEVAVATWFADGEYRNGKFLAASDFKRGWIEQHYMRECRKAFGANVTITVKEEPKGKAA